MLTHDSPNAPAKFVVEREEICALFFFGHGMPDAGIDKGVGGMHEV